MRKGGSYLCTVRPIYVMDANGFHQTRLTKIDAGSCTRPEEFMLPAKRMGAIRHLEWEPAWSPDGSKIAFASHTTAHK